MADFGNGTVFSETDDNNASGTQPSHPEGQTPGSVNNGIRALQGAAKRWWDRINGTITSTGSLNNYVLTYSVAPAALYNGERYLWKASFANTGTATLNINVLGAKTIKKVVSGVLTALASGDISSGAWIDCQYNLADDSFVILSGLTQSNVLSDNNTFTGTNTFNNTLTAAQAFALSGDITPAQITASVNDYAPTGHATAYVIRLNTNAADYSITGLAGGTDGRKVEIHNTGSFHFFLEDESASSTAANRFATQSAGWAQVFPGGIAYLTYDATSSRWRAAVGAGIRAPQSVMETATSESQQVTPGRQHNHPGHPKFWAFVTVAAGVPTLQTSYNVTSITDTAVGRLTVTIATDFSGADWAPSISIGHATAAMANYASIAAGSIIAQAWGSASDAAVDPGSWSVSGLGDQ